MITQYCAIDKRVIIRSGCLLPLAGIFGEVVARPGANGTRERRLHRVVQARSVAASADAVHVTSFTHEAATGRLTHRKSHDQGGSLVAWLVDPGFRSHHLCVDAAATQDSLSLVD